MQTPDACRRPNNWISGGRVRLSSGPSDELDQLSYREVWAVDFEFTSGAGERPEPVCLVAQELRSGRRISLWNDQFGSSPPYSTDAGALFVAYYASAEIGCHLALGWPVPLRILDLFVEFRNRTNGLLKSDSADCE